MKGLKSFWSLMAAMAVTVFSAQAQEDVSQACVPVNQDAPATTVAVKAVKSETVTANMEAGSQFAPVSDYKAAEKAEAATSGKSAKKVARKVASVNELAGQYVLTGTSLLTAGYNGVCVTVEAAGTDSIAMNNFWASGYNTVVKAKVDVATGAISIPAQVMGQHGTYGDIKFAKTNLSSGQPADDDVTGTLNADGTISLNDAWGAYVMASSTATSWSYFAIVNAAMLEKCNATFTGKNHSDGTLDSYGVVFTQVAENQATVKNLGNYGQTVTIDLNRNKTANIPSSLIAYNSTYGDFYSYNLTFTDTGASISTNDAVTTAATDLKQLIWSNWGVVTGSTAGSRYLVAAYDSCNITTGVDIVYPTISVTEFEGEGTEASPYLIKTRDDMILLSDKVAEITDLDCTTPPATTAYCRAYLGKYFRVENDIDMNGYKFTPVGADWAHVFAGQFDGNGKTISNLNVSAKGYAGLFGRTDTLTVIKDLTIANATVNNTSSYTGALVAWAMGKIENVKVINSTISGSGLAVGGIAGIAFEMNNSSVTNSTVTGLYGYTGGVASEIHAPMTNCYAQNVTIVSASASSATPGYPAGGVVGNCYFTDMENCWFSGVLDAYSQYSQYQTVGGVAGMVTAGTVKQCFAVGTIHTYSAGAVAGGVVGYLRGNVENSYFNGRVDDLSARATGGAVGRISAYTIVSGGETQECSMKNVYATASVTAETYQYQSQTNAQYNEVIGMIIDGSNPTITNVYCDKQIANLTKSSYAVNTEDLVSAAGPAGFDASVWSFTAGRYPALKVSEGTAASKLSTTAVILPTGASFDKFTKNATINKDADVTVAFYKAGSLSNDGYYAKINGSTIEINSESKFGNDTVYVVAQNVGAYYRIAKVAPIPYEGSGEEADPFLIKTKADLILLSELTTNGHQLFPDTYFKIVNDIDLEYDAAYLGICADKNDASCYFGGVIDGDGHYIHKMKFDEVVWTTPGTETSWGTINTSACEAYKGFIGRLSADGVVKNLNIAADCDLHFYASSGAVVGYSSGTIENCKNYANVTGNSCWIGGIAGHNLKDGKIIGCYNEGTVLGGYGQVGGIAGLCTGYIENSMNVGRIEIRQLATNYATQLQSAGGIAGTSSAGGKFVNCVNAGTVSAQIKRAGGITGYWNAVSATSTSSYYKNDMLNCVNYGTVLTADASTIGAIAGGETQSTSEDIKNNYWDVQILDIAADCNATHEGMTGVETSVLTSGKALEGFDTDVWQFEAGKYPVLKAFASEPAVQAAAATTVIIPTGVTVKNLSADATISAGTPTLAQGTAFTLDGTTLKGLPNVANVVADTLTIKNGDIYVKIIPISAMPVNPLSGEGTAENPWKITNPTEWNAFANYMSNTSNTIEGGYVELVNDIDFTNHADGIIPIGGDGVTAFAGNFNGNNHSVKGYSYTTTAAGQGGLFGTIAEGAVVENLVAEGSVVGGLGGSTGKTKFGYVGGVVGKLYGTLKNVENKGKAEGITTYTGGLAGYAYQSSSFDTCKNSGEVTSAAAYVGGLAGYVYEGVTFTDCENSGKISSTVAAGYCGGIAATALPSSYIRCTNNGEIAAGSSAGIVANCAGKASVGEYTFDHCVNNGNVTGNATIAGITAVQGTTAGNNVCNYLYCENNGDITATATAAVSSSSVCGIAAFHSAGSTFDHCVNNGFITNTKSVYTAGIAGYYKGSNASYPEKYICCVNNGPIVSQAQQIAGIVAYVSNYTTIDSCVNYGSIENGLWGAAGIAYTFTGAESKMTNCMNFGDVTVAQYNAGGIVGNTANVNTVIKGCANYGNVATTSTAETNNYGVGGIVANCWATVTDCFNAGNVTGKARVGGIVGSPSYNATTARTQLVNCVNIGSVKADEGCGGMLVGTLAGSEATYWGDNNTATNCYYLNDLSARAADQQGMGDNNVIGTGVGVKELVALNMNASASGVAMKADGDQAWVQADNYSYPMPAIAAEDAAAQAHAAAIVLADGDTYNNVVSNKFNAGTPEGVDWKISNDDITISDNDVNVTGAVQATVKFTAVGASDMAVADVDWYLTLDVPEPTGIDDVNGLTVVDEAVYTVAGVKVAKPAEKDGQVYIVVRKYNDGTVKAVKVRN